MGATFFADGAFLAGVVRWEGFFAVVFSTGADFFAVFFAGVRSLAQRSRCAAAIRALPSGLILPRFGGMGGDGLLVDPFGRPGRFFSGAPALFSVAPSPATALRSCCKRLISASSARMISFVFINILSSPSYPANRQETGESQLVQPVRPESSYFGL